MTFLTTYPWQDAAQRRVLASVGPGGQAMFGGVPLLRLIPRRLIVLRQSDETIIPLLHSHLPDGRPVVDIIYLQTHHAIRIVFINGSVT